MYSDAVALSGLQVEHRWGRGEEGQAGTAGLRVAGVSPSGLRSGEHRGVSEGATARHGGGEALRATRISDGVPGELAPPALSCAPGRLHSPKCPSQSPGHGSQAAA